MLCALSNKLSYKKFSKTIDLMGVLLGGEAPPRHKNWTRQIKNLISL